MAVPCAGYKAVSRSAAMSLPGSYRHAAHAMLHSPLAEERKLFGYYPVRHAVMLQLRFDGLVGFPGGFVETGESLEVGLQREVAEELGPGVDGLDFTESDYVASHVCPDKPLCLHFFCKNVKISVFSDIERRLHEADQYGLETLGVIRCPLYTMRDDTGGLPAFLRNNFIGNSRDQLLLGLQREGILTEEEIRLAMDRSGMFQNIAALQQVATKL